MAKDPRGTKLAPHGSKWNNRNRGSVGQSAFGGSGLTSARLIGGSSAWKA